MQAASMVASKLNETKDAVAYMRNLARLEKNIDAILSKENK